MHSHSLDNWQHEHVFLGSKHEHNERRAWSVVALTTAMMITEIIGGHLFGSSAVRPRPPVRLRSIPVANLTAQFDSRVFSAIGKH